MDILISIIGALIFYSIMIYIYRYASGKHKIKNETNREKYNQWLNSYGKILRNGVTMLMIIYGVFFLFQLISNF